MAKCPQCSADVAEEDSFCRACGAALGSRAQRRRSRTVEQLIAEHVQRIADHPDDDSAHYSLGLAYLYSAQPAAAAEQFVAVTKLSPDFADAYAKLALAWGRMGNYARARQAIEQARQLQPDRDEFRQIAERLQQLS